MSSKLDTRSEILNAALTMVQRGVDPTMAGVAARAGVSRQAVYLHFQDRGALLLALVQHADQARGLDVKLAAIAKAPSARAAVAAVVALGASDNPGLWPVERVFDSLRQGNAAAEAFWQERFAGWFEACCAIAERFKAEDALAPHLSVDSAADVLSSLTSLRLWEELVVGRGWTADRYRSHVTYLSAGALTH